MRGRGRLSFAAGGELVAALSLAAALTMTARVVVLVRPALSEATYSIV
jgi:hypothetical protein